MMMMMICIIGTLEKLCVCVQDSRPVDTSVQQGWRCQTGCCHFCRSDTRVDTHVTVCRKHVDSCFGAHYMLVIPHFLKLTHQFFTILVFVHIIVMEYRFLQMITER